MSDDEKIERALLVNSTYRYSWQLTKEKFENCNFRQSIRSPTFSIEISGQESDWYLRMDPKGREEEERNKVAISLFQETETEIYKVSFKSAIKTQAGYWPKDFVKGSFDKGNYFGHTDVAKDDRDVSKGWGGIICTTEDFEKYFVESKIILVTDLVIHVDEQKDCNSVKVHEEFMDNIRSISTREELADFALISGNERFPCHRVLLAVRSEYFEALFRNEPTKTELKVDEAPDLVNTMLEFMAKGRIPEDIDDKAMDLILMADMYRLDLLTVGCETSLVNNLTPDNAVETLITIDKVKHISKQEHRLKVLAYINKEADQVVESEDWKKFVQNYPDLITEAFLFKCSVK